MQNFLDQILSSTPGYILELMILRDVVLLKKYGIAVKFVTSDDPSEFDAAIDEKTKAVFVETIGNPKYNVSPISEIAKVCNLYACSYIC